MQKAQKVSILSFFPRISSLIFMAIFIGGIFIGPRMMNQDGDLGRHLTIGNYILTTGNIPLTDIFSHTMTGQPLTPHEWLAEVIFALADRVMGLNGVVFVTALVLAGTLWLLFHELLKNKANIVTALFFTILAAATTSIHWLTRPHIFTFLMITLWMITLERLRKGETNRWWLLPIIMLFWANLHGAFISGFVILATYAIHYAYEYITQREPETAQKIRKSGKLILIGGLVSLAATLINPAGVNVWKTGIGFLGNSYLVNHTEEYLSPNFHQAATWPYLISILLAILLFGITNKRRPVLDLLLIGSWVAMALYSARNIPLFTLVATPFLVNAADDWIAEVDKNNRFSSYNHRLWFVENQRRYFYWAIPILILVVFLFSKGIKLDEEQTGNVFDPGVFPVNAVDWVQANSPGEHMFNYFTWGGYLLYRLWPEQKVFIDGQTDFYGEALTRQYEEVIDVQPGWQDILREYQIDWMILPVNSNLQKALIEDTSWRVVYQDQTAVVIKHE